MKSGCPCYITSDFFRKLKYLFSLLTHKASKYKWHPLIQMIYKSKVRDSSFSFRTNDYISRRKNTQHNTGFSRIFDECPGQVQSIKKIHRQTRKTIEISRFSVLMEDSDVWTHVAFKKRIKNSIANFIHP